MLIGIVGKPNCGKSTFFKAATLAEIEIGNRPFVTIKPNHGTGYVKVECVEKEFNTKCNPRIGYCIDGNRFVAIDLLDVAGLVPGAHEGKGMGNEFLDDLNEANALIHVIDVSGSTDEKGESVKALSYDPSKDIEFLENELDYWYLRILKKGWEKFVRTIRQENKDIKKAIAKQLSGLRVTEEHVEEAVKELKLTHKPDEWSEDDLYNLSRNLRKKTKPIIIAANKIDVEGAKYNFEKIKKKFKNYTIIGCSSESELALREATKKELIKYIPGEDNFEVLNDKINEKQKKGLEFLKKFLKENKTTGVQEVLNEIVFNILKMICVFPGGVHKLTDSKGRVLPDCFLLKEDSTVIDFCEMIHSDFVKNFVKAIDVRSKRVIGKEHKLNNRDIIEIMLKK